MYVCSVFFKSPVNVLLNFHNLKNKKKKSKRRTKTMKVKRHHNFMEGGTENVSEFQHR